jgi:hypothetical protein
LGTLIDESMHGRMMNESTCARSLIVCQVVRVHKARQLQSALLVAAIEGGSSPKRLLLIEKYCALDLR